MENHPYKSCAIKCTNVVGGRPETLCGFLAVICIVINGFSGLTNVGTDHWLLITLTLFNMLGHILAGLFLFLGTFWENRTLKLLYCWLMVVLLISAIAGLVAHVFLMKKGYIIWGKDCYGNSTIASFVAVGLATCWLVSWDVYSPMMVLAIALEEEY